MLKAENGFAMYNLYGDSVLSLDHCVDPSPLNINRVISQCFRINFEEFLEDSYSIPYVFLREAIKKGGGGWSRNTL